MVMIYITHGKAGVTLKAIYYGKVRSLPKVNQLFTRLSNTYLPTVPGMSV